MNFYEIFLSDCDYQREAEGYSIIINKKIVELHQGKVGVVSEGPGKGATFYVDIPSKRPPSKSRAVSL